MTYQAKCLTMHDFKSKKDKEAWDQMMLQEVRDWKKVFDLFPSSLAYYIADVRIQSVTNNDASSELEELNEFFEWDESDFYVSWELKAYLNQPELEYESFEDVAQALLGEKQPEMDAHFFWKEQGKQIEEVQWYKALDASMTISDLQLK